MWAQQESLSNGNVETDVLHALVAKSMCNLLIQLAAMTGKPQRSELFRSNLFDVTCPSMIVCLKYLHSTFLLYLQTQVQEKQENPIVCSSF